MPSCDVQEIQGIGGMTTYVLLDPAVGARAEVIPERGALATRFRIGDDELLYLDEASVADRSRNVRGGIPVLFPIAGRLPGDGYTLEGRRYELKQHGFARNRAWEVLGAYADDASARLECRLTADPETRAAFPFDFEARLSFTLFGGRLLLELAVANPGATALPLHLGFHPYFRVPDAEKGRARVETLATRAFDNRLGRTGALPPLDFTAEELDLHLLDHPVPATTLTRGAAPPIHLAFSEAFRCLVLWTQRGKDFICLEPWTAPAGALASGEGLLSVEPGAVAAFAFEIHSSS